MMSWRFRAPRPVPGGAGRAGCQSRERGGAVGGGETVTKQITQEFRGFEFSSG